jgi:hypothetical protein
LASDIGKGIEIKSLLVGISGGVGAELDLVP